MFKNNSMLHIAVIASNIPTGVYMLGELEKDNESYCCSQGRARDRIAEYYFASNEDDAFRLAGIELDQILLLLSSDDYTLGMIYALQYLRLRLRTNVPEAFQIISYVIHTGECI